MTFVAWTAILGSALAPEPEVYSTLAECMEWAERTVGETIELLSPETLDGVTVFRNDQNIIIGELVRVSCWADESRFSH